MYALKTKSVHDSSFNLFCFDFYCMYKQYENPEAQKCHVNLTIANNNYIIVNNICNEYIINLWAFRFFGTPCSYPELVHKIHSKERNVRQRV